MNIAVAPQEEPLDPFQAAMQSQDRDIPLLVETALANNRARLAFQPVMRADRSGRPAFYEGLIRLLDVSGRVLPAGQFLPQIEDGALGREIDCATLRLAMQALSEHPGIRISVNMSARSIADTKWRHTLNRGLRTLHGVSGRLIFEINESSAMALPEVVIRFMEDMQPKGITFALDHFGAGMTSFRYLKDFMFDLVKIDRHFTRDIATSSDNQVLAEALIMVAQQFEMFTVAEAVETQIEAEMFRELGVDCLQGYLFGAPKFRF